MKKKPADRNWSPDIILARFKRQSPICLEYIVADAKTTSLLLPLIEFRLDATNRTVISGTCISGVCAATPFLLDHRVGTLKGKTCFADGQVTPDKMAMKDAEHVLINDSFVVWVPNEVLFPFLNLLVLLKGDQ